MNLDEMSDEDLLKEYKRLSQVKEAYNIKQMTEKIKINSFK